MQHMFPLNLSNIDALLILPHMFTMPQTPCILIMNSFKSCNLKVGIEDEIPKVSE